jgi:hypothetical protein
MYIHRVAQLLVLIESVSIPVPREDITKTTSSLRILLLEPNTTQLNHTRATSKVHVTSRADTRMPITQQLQLYLICSCALRSSLSVSR